MRLKNLVAINAIGLGLFLLFSFVPEARAFNESGLTRKIKATAIKGESIDEVLDDLAVDYQIPVGIELGDSKLTPRREIEMDLPETTLKYFLDSVIAKDPRYKWKLERGVLHVSPVTARDTFVESLLETKISNFTMASGSTKYRIFHNIMNLPEIGSQLAIAEVAPMIFINFGNMHKLEKNIFFSESNLTLRELLDRLVLKTEIKLWVITRWGDNNEYITLRS